ncbi:hypothetical protein SETIT_4G107600v2, partial [Setaria italica]
NQTAVFSRGPWKPNVFSKKERRETPCRLLTTHRTAKPKYKQFCWHKDYLKANLVCGKLLAVRRPREMGSFRGGPHVTVIREETGASTKEASLLGGLHMGIQLACNIDVLFKVLYVLMVLYVMLFAC